MTNEDCRRCEEERLKKAWASKDRDAIRTSIMITCPKCGNKRCPKAEWHNYKCTNSNEPGQVPKFDLAFLARNNLPTDVYSQFDIETGKRTEFE